MRAATSPGYAMGLRVFDAPGTLMHFNMSSKASQLTEPEKPESKSERTVTKLSTFCSPRSHSAPIHSTNKPLPINIRCGPEPAHQDITGSTCKTETQMGWDNGNNQMGSRQTLQAQTDRLENPDDALPQSAF